MSKVENDIEIHTVGPIYWIKVSVGEDEDTMPIHMFKMGCYDDRYKVENVEVSTTYGYGIRCNMLEYGKWNVAPNTDNFNAMINLCVNGYLELQQKAGDSSDRDRSQEA